MHADNRIMTYYGSTIDFKSRYYKHKTSFEKRPVNHTTLSSYVWKIKDKKLPFKVTWSIKARGHPYNGGRICDLCNTEKLIILKENNKELLNKRDELLETCRHRRKYLLASVKTHLDTG